MCKVLQEAIRVQQEWSSMHSIYSIMLHQNRGCGCVCVERDRDKQREKERESSTTFGMCNRVFVHYRTWCWGASELNQITELWIFSVCSARDDLSRKSPLSASVDRLNTARFQGQNEESFTQNKNTLTSSSSLKQQTFNFNCSLYTIEGSSYIIFFSFVFFTLMTSSHFLNSHLSFLYL